MIRSILVVCVGNICRSPVAERQLRAFLPDLVIGSAGLAALTGQPADAVMTEVSAARGLSLAGHIARQFTPALGRAHDLILVMEPGHRVAILHLAPHLSGKTMLLDRWTDARGIADPYRQSRGAYERAYDDIARATDSWASTLIESRR